MRPASNGAGAYSTQNHFKKLKYLSQVKKKGLFDFPKYRFLLFILLALRHQQVNKPLSALVTMSEKEE